MTRATQRVHLNFLKRFHSVDQGRGEYCQVIGGGDRALPAGLPVEMVLGESSLSFPS